MMQSPRYRKCILALWRGLCSIPLALRLSEGLGVAISTARECRRFICWALLGREGGPGWRYWLKVLVLMLTALVLELWLLTGSFLPLELWKQQTGPGGVHQQQPREAYQEHLQEQRLWPTNDSLRQCAPPGRTALVVGEMRVFASTPFPRGCAYLFPGAIHPATAQVRDRTLPQVPCGLCQGSLQALPHHVPRWLACASVLGEFDPDIGGGVATATPNVRANLETAE